MGRPEGVGVKGRMRDGRVEFPLPPIGERREGTCRSCEQELVWVRSRKGKNLPLDLSTARQYPDGSWWAESHFSNCPDADGFRRGRSAD